MNDKPPSSDEYEKSNVYDISERLGPSNFQETGPLLGGGDGGGGMNEVYSRLGALEASVQNVGSSVTEVKSDIRRLLAAGIAAAVVVIGAVISSHLITAGNVDSARKEITDLIRYEVGRLAAPEATKN